MLSFDGDATYDMREASGVLKVEEEETPVCEVFLRSTNAERVQFSA